MKLSDLFSSIQEVADYANSHFRDCIVKNLTIIPQGFQFTIGFYGGLGEEKFYCPFSPEEVAEEKIDVESHKQKWKQAYNYITLRIKEKNEKIDNLLQDEKVKEYIKEFPYGNAQRQLNFSIYNNIK